MKTDEEFIERIKKGNISAFEYIVKKYKKKVYTIIFNIIRDTQDAEDLVQEVFLRVYSSIKRFKGRSNFYTWLYRISINVSFDYLKKNRRNLEFRDDFSISVDAIEVEKGLGRKEIIEKIFDLANNLPKKQKLIFILKFQNDFSNKEIGEILGLSQDTVKANLYHALKKIRDALKKEGFLREEYYD